MCQCITVVALEQEVLVQRISSKTEIPKLKSMKIMK